MKKCYFCNKVFQREKNFKKHLVKCSILNNVNLLNTDEDLFNLLKNLLKTNESLKSRIEKLEKQVEKETRKQKIDILEWLNVNKHTRITFKEFIENIKFSISCKELILILFNPLLLAYFNKDGCHLSSPLSSLLIQINKLSLLIFIVSIRYLIALIAIEYFPATQIFICL